MEHEMGERDGSGREYVDYQREGEVHERNSKRSRGHCKDNRRLSLNSISMTYHISELDVTSALKRKKGKGAFKSLFSLDNISLKK